MGDAQVIGEIEEAAGQGRVTMLSVAANTITDRICLTPLSSELRRSRTQGYLPGA